MADEPAIDSFRKLMGKVHDLIENRGSELTYAEGLFMAHSFKAEAEWVEAWLEDGALRDVVEEELSRTEAHLEMYRIRDRLDQGEDWKPEQELGDG
jgi:predicted RNA-binding protein